MSERVQEPKIWTGVTDWLPVRDPANSECASADLASLDFDEWWTDGGSGSPWGDVYIKVPRRSDETVHRVHCRRSETPRLGVRDGDLCWLVTSAPEAKSVPGTERDALADRLEHEARSVDGGYGTGLEGVELRAIAAALRTPAPDASPFNPAVALAGEYEVGKIVRAAVDMDPATMRFYLLCSVGELAQRIARAYPPAPGTASEGVVLAECMAPAPDTAAVREPDGWIVEHRVAGRDGDEWVQPPHAVKTSEGQVAAYLAMKAESWPALEFRARPFVFTDGTPAAASSPTDDTLAHFRHLVSLAEPHQDVIEMPVGLLRQVAAAPSPELTRVNVYQDGELVAANLPLGLDGVRVAVGYAVLPQDSRAAAPEPDATPKARPDTLQANPVGSEPDAAALLDALVRLLEADEAVDECGFAVPGPVLHEQVEARKAARHLVARLRSPSDSRVLNDD